MQMLRGDRTKYLGLVMAVAFSTFLMSHQSSIFVGKATQLGFLRVQFDIRLVLGDIEKRFGAARGGEARLMALEREAEVKGFKLVARKAAAARQ